jgi:hypothetical protein
MPAYFLNTREKLELTVLPPAAIAGRAWTDNRQVIVCDINADAQDRQRDRL